MPIETVFAEIVTYTVTKKSNIFLTCNLCRYARFLQAQSHIFTYLMYCKSTIGCILQYLTTYVYRVVKCACKESGLVHLRPIVDLFYGH